MLWLTCARPEKPMEQINIFPILSSSFAYTANSTRLYHASNNNVSSQLSSYFPPNVTQTLNVVTFYASELASRILFQKESLEAPIALLSALVMETHLPALLSSDGVDSMFELNKKGRRESFCQWVFGGVMGLQWRRWRAIQRRIMRSGTTCCVG